MGMLVDGTWQDQEVPRTNAEGAFIRNESPYRDVIGSPLFPVEADRYHLFVNAGCPWAYRTILYRSIKKLQPYLTMSYTLPAAGKQGWTFGEQGEPLLGAIHMHDVYTEANDKFTGRCTVPVLWDKQSNTIVNNESADIIRMFDSAFDDEPGVNPTRYYLTEHASEIDALNDEIYTTINNGVYRCGFSQSQAAYDEAFDTCVVHRLRSLTGACLRHWCDLTWPITASSSAICTVSLITQIFGPICAISINSQVLPRLSISQRSRGFIMAAERQAYCLGALILIFLNTIRERYCESARNLSRDPRLFALAANNTLQTQFI